MRDKPLCAETVDLLQNQFRTHYPSARHQRLVAVCVGACARAVEADPGHGWRADDALCFGSILMEAQAAGLAVPAAKLRHQVSDALLLAGMTHGRITTLTVGLPAPAGRPLRLVAGRHCLVVSSPGSAHSRLSWTESRLIDAVCTAYLGGGTKGAREYAGERGFRIRIVEPRPPGDPNRHLEVIPAPGLSCEVSAGDARRMCHFLRHWRQEFLREP